MNQRNSQLVLEKKQKQSKTEQNKMESVKTNANRQE